jgi:hypothetical protein
MNKPGSCVAAFTLSTRFLAFVPVTRRNSNRARVIEALTKCVKELLYETVRARLGTRPAPDRMNIQSLRRRLGFMSATNRAAAHPYFARNEVPSMNFSDQSHNSEVL